MRARVCVRLREWGCKYVCDDMCVRAWALMHVRLRVRFRVRAGVRACEHASIYACVINVSYHYIFRRSL